MDGQDERWPSVKLANFSCWTKGVSSDIPRGYISTREYQPPEAGQTYGPAHDIWALGTMLYKIAPQEYPCVYLTHQDIEEAKSEFIQREAGNVPRGVGNTE